MHCFIVWNLFIPAVTFDKEFMLLVLNKKDHICSLKLVNSFKKKSNDIKSCKKPSIIEELLKKPIRVKIDKFLFTPGL